MECKYVECMQSIIADEWVAFDHTFKIAANIGYQRESHWITQYNSAFIALNEKAQVLSWQLTSTSLDEVEQLLSNLKCRHENAGKPISYICVDNCCQVSGKLTTIFGKVTVVLDLFHAIQRVTKRIPSRYEYSTDCSHEFSKCFRTPGDSGLARTASTPAPAVIEKNIVNWLEKWATIDGTSVINDHIVKEVDHLLKHVRKGCLSGIPVGCGTNLNENLHRLLNSHFNASKIGIMLAYALLSILLFSHNNKQHTRGKLWSVPFPSTIRNVIPGGFKETFGIMPKHNEEQETLRDLLFQELGIGEEIATDIADTALKESMDRIVVRALRLSASYIQFRELTKTNSAKIEDWLRSDKIRMAPPKDDSQLQASPLHLETLKVNVSSWNFDTLTVPGDGNCFFHAVRAAIEHIWEADSCVANLKGLKSISAMLSGDDKIQFLRNELTNEFLGGRKHLYEPSYAGIDYTAEAIKFRQDGFMTLR